MSKYTTEVRWMVEHYAPDPNHSLSIDARILAALPKLFPYTFPIWLEEYRQTLETKIIRHYYFREIAFETVELWRQFMQTRLNEIMPYYNELYKTVARDFDYMNDTYLTESIVRNRTDLAENSYNEESSGEGNSTSKGKTTNDLQQLNSDLPGAVGAQALGGDYYANNLSKNTGDVTSDITGGNKSSGKRQGEGKNKVEVGEQVITSRWGNTGGKSQTQLMLEFRQSLINIDKLILDELQDMFFNLY